MIRLVLRRLATLPLVLVGVVIVLFLVSHVLPTDTVRLVAGEDATPEVRAAVRHQLGLDQPVWQQFVTYAGRLLHADFGISLRFSLPVSSLVRQALPASLWLVGAATVVAILIAFPVGILSARYRGSWFDV